MSGIKTRCVEEILIPKTLQWLFDLISNFNVYEILCAELQKKKQQKPKKKILNLKTDGFLKNK